jgi:hypothetical protein
MKNNELIGPVPETPEEALANWRSVRQRVHDRFDKARSEGERVALLALYCSAMNLAEKAIAPADLEKFREIRGHGYSLLIVKESLDGDRLRLDKAEAVMQRELESGRMAPDHILRDRKELAKLAGDYVRTQQQLKQQHAEERPGLLGRILSWFHN